MHQPQPIPEPTSLVSDWHRQKVAVLVAVHLGLTLSVATLWRLVYLNFFDFETPAPLFLVGTLVGVFYGFQIGQIVLLACWGGLASQPWFLRLPRFLCLTVWMQLLEILGEYLCDGAGAGLLAEEYLSGKFLALLTPALVLISFGAIQGGRLVHTRAKVPTNSWQFGTRRLLLLTAEAAVLLAIARIVIPGNFHWDDLWRAVTGHRPDEIVLAATSATVLPVVFFAMSSRRTWQRYVALGAYLVVIAIAQSWLNFAFSNIPNLFDWSPEFPIRPFQFVVTHFSAAATILLTFWALRRIGYDFRRRGEGSLGRNSSNANSSAASAAA